jgi:GT2 family glycosyltransferase
MPKSISVVIPNYNGQTLLEQNLPSVFKALEKIGGDYEIIVADDASTDDSVAYLRKNYPTILVVANTINEGFANNINTGIFLASKDLVFALNTDVQLTTDYFLSLLPYFDLPTTFGVMGCIKAWDTDTIQDAAKYPHYTVKGIQANTNYLPIEAEETQTEGNKAKLLTTFLSGANALMDRAKLLQLQGFCDLFSPYYGEDLELSLRAWRLGYVCYYEHRAVCRHPNSVTISKYSKRSKIKTISSRNKFSLNYIHREGMTLFLWILSMVGKSLFLWLKFDWIFYKALYLFWQQLPKLRQFKLDFKKLQHQHHKEDISLKIVCEKIRQEVAKLKVIYF